MWKDYKFPVAVLIVQLIFLVLFGVFVKYPKLEVPEGTDESQAHEVKAALAESNINKYYAFFQDVHVMMFIGFGFLMTFLKRYGFGSVGLNMMVAAMVLQWATITNAWIFNHGYINLEITDLISAEFCAAAILISFGAVLGKVSPLQLLVLALIEVVLFQANEYIVFEVFHASDVGDSMVVHAFGAYFGLTVARILYVKDVEEAEAKEGSVYHSDLFAMIGTIFLWLFWPSFNSGTAEGEGQYRAVINTYFSLAACAVVTFAISSMVNKGKLNMVHIQNATLAGGVAVGTMADMMIQPWAAILIGCVAAVLSVIGYKFITPLLTKKLKIHDTCGVNNLHGMPGVLSGIGGILCAAFQALEPHENNGTSGKQAGFQAAGLAVSVAMAVVGGVLTGFLLRLPIWDQPKKHRVFDDADYWELPEEGFPGGEASQEKSKDVDLESPNDKP